MTGPPGPPDGAAGTALTLGSVSLGGVVGAEARYGVGLLLPHSAGAWPWATLLVNVSGCVLIGVLMGVLDRCRPHPLVRPLLGVGVLGGYTTFSSYAVDVVGLVEAGRTGPAIGYLLATPLLAVLAVAAGLAAVRSRR